MTTNKLNMLKKKTRGFTLVELIVVITIMGLFLTVTIPAFGRFLQSSRLSGQINQMSGFLRAARRTAITKNINTVFILDFNNNRYFFFEDLNNDGTRDATEFRSTVVELPPGITLQGHTFSQPAIFFGPKGTTMESGMINLQNAHNSTRAIRVFGGTGNISIQ